MTPSLEEYLKTIYILIQTKKEARVTDIANYLGYAKASVNRALNTLKRAELIQYEAYREIALTQKGEKEAKKIITRHNILKAFLTDVLEVAPELAEKEAKAMKSSVSEETIYRFQKYIKSIIPVNELECQYNPECERCKTCIRQKTKKKYDGELS